MNNRTSIRAFIALLFAAAGLAPTGASAQLRPGVVEADRGRTLIAQLRSSEPGFELRYGGPSNESNTRRALPDRRIWAIAQERVPGGRIVSTHLRGSIYSFRIVSPRGRIVDVDVDRFQGRIVSVRGGP